jgi:hypothetical protein
MESGTLTLRTNDAVVISPTLANKTVIKLIPQTMPDLRIKERKTETAGVCVDVVAPKPKEFETWMSDIWLDSFHGTLTRDEKNCLALQVVCDDPRPWKTRGSRLGELPSGPLPRKQCNQDKWLDIVKSLLDASPYKDLHGTVNEKARTFVARWLGSEPGNASERDRLNQQINNLRERGVPGWYEEACAFLFKDPGPYHSFTYNKVKEERGIERPRDYAKPQQPPKEAPDDQQNEFIKAIKAWEDNHGKLMAWNNRFAELFHSSENVIAFLQCNLNNQHPDSLRFLACRAAAVVVLELAAKHVAEHAVDAIQDVPLASLFSVSLGLPWVFEDGTKEPVDRLTIQPVETAAKIPTASPQSPPGIPAPTATTPSNRQ